jgi:hypothetical protein
MPADPTTWVEPAPPRAADARDSQPGTHVIRVRDLRERFGDDEVYRAHCSCGWTSEPHSGITAARTARRDGTNHVTLHSPRHGHARRVVS